MLKMNSNIVYLKSEVIFYILRQKLNLHFDCDEFNVWIMPIISMKSVLDDIWIREMIIDIENEFWFVQFKS